MFSNFELWGNIIPTWFSAIGTVSTVIVAIFARPIREWWCRPKIFMECNRKNKVCVENIINETESSDGSKMIKIRVLLQNNGRNVAFHSVLVVDSYFKKRDKADEYVLTEFTPKKLKDHCESIPNKIAPHLKYYYDVAVIQKADGMMNRSGDEKAKQFYKLYLLGEGKSTPLGKGDFIVPMKFYASNTNSIISYLKIYWDNDNFSTETSVFSVEMITEEQYKKIKIIN